MFVFISSLGVKRFVKVSSGERALSVEYGFSDRCNSSGDRNILVLSSGKNTRNIGTKEERFEVIVPIYFHSHCETFRQGFLRQENANV